jgi:hypothetical protein
MAAHAGARCDSRMREGRSCPAHRPMAGVAGHGRWHMRRRLAYRDSLIVAFGASSRSDTIMGKKRRCPICRPVAAVAVDRGRQVVRRLKCRHDTSTG